MLTRRQLLASGALALVLTPRRLRAAGRLVEIAMKSDADGGVVWFDPVGIRVLPGDVVRWVCVAGIHTVAAYHPANADHPLRIPEGATPWASAYLWPGQNFEVTLLAEGVYDYYCALHEEAGMVGRIIVGSPSGPGAAAPVDLPPRAIEALPSIDAIMRSGAVRHGAP